MTLIQNSSTKRALAIGAGVTAVWFFILTVVVHLSLDKATAIALLGILPTWLALTHTAKIAAAAELKVQLDIERNTQLGAQTKAQETIAAAMNPPSKGAVNAEKLREIIRRKTPFRWTQGADNRPWAFGAKIRSFENETIVLFTPTSQSSTAAFIDIILCADIEIMDFTAQGHDVVIKVLSRQATWECNPSQTYEEAMKYPQKRVRLITRPLTRWLRQ